MGYSGAGKSTLARALGERYGIPVLHFDRVHWAPGWQERDRGEAHRMVHERRLSEADEIVILDFPRSVCLFRAWKRYFRYRGRTRADMGEGCPEKMDLEFMWWILWKGRTRQKRGEFRAVWERYPDKSVVLKDQRDIDRYLEELPC